MHARDTRQLEQGSKEIALLRVGIFTLLLLFLSLQADGFRLSRNQERQELLLIPFTLLFCGGLLWLLTSKVIGTGKHQSWLLKCSGWNGNLVAIMVFLAISGALITYSSHYYAAMGYRLHPFAMIMVFGCAVISVGAGFWRKARSGGNYLIGVVILAYVAVYLLSIWSFPIAIQRSDMLPLISAAGKTILNGHNPYHFYTFPTEIVFLTYLPGTVLAFLPAVVLQIDLRFLNIVYVVILAVLIYRASSIQYRSQVAALIGLFLLSPYVQYRHEIYTQPHWLSIVACLLLAQKRKLLWAAAIFGVSAALSQFSWILFPFLLLFIFQQKGYRCALSAAVIALSVATLTVAPFAVWSPHAFFYGVLSHWQNMPVNARPVNFSYWLGAAVGPQHLQVVQFVVLAGIFVYCVAARKCSTLTECLCWMAIALTVFIMLNILVWGYFFLLLEVILLLYVISANGWFQSGSEIQSNIL